MEEDFIKSYLPSFNKAFGINEDELREYYNESKYIGYPDEPSGSVWTSEGKSIYCFIRILKPKHILEIGNFKGKSTNHILQAVDKNGFGEVDLVDIQDYLEYDKLHSKNFNRYLEDSVKFLDKPLDYDLYIQDGCHEYQHVLKELQLITNNTTCDFNIWSHDYFTVIPNHCEVKRAWNSIDDFEYKLPMIDSVSDCGFVISKYNKQK